MHEPQKAYSLISAIASAIAMPVSCVFRVCVYFDLIKLRNMKAGHAGMQTPRRPECLANYALVL